jgi:hypothetical protein
MDWIPFYSILVGVVCVAQPINLMCTLLSLLALEIQMASILLNNNVSDLLRYFLELS